VKRLADPAKFLKPGDFIEFPRYDGHMGVWEVRSVLLGGLGEESVYGIRCVDLIDPRDFWGVRVTEMYVPTVLLESVGYTVKHKTEAPA
jgi:hypothetical protein